MMQVATALELLRTAPADAFNEDPNRDAEQIAARQKFAGELGALLNDQDVRVSLVIERTED